MNGDVDWWAVNVVVTERIQGLARALNKAERIEVVRRLVGKLSAAELGELLGVTGRTIERDRVEIRNELGQELIAS
ncbi:DUF7368 family protein [Mycobacterium malmoense]|uniref:DUF7368 family protein n=1 Tax=Mycobacterium malmoense TaxID=1780 RepID=UPI0008F8E09E|nr:hypothetical protein [Mycobacterium malmoense]OIN79989.1 hypothetical protein BMG05_15030 [Mycobacterium malmoense]